MARPHKGFFKPKNPQKYMGDPNNIVHRSMIEKRYMKFFDEQESIVAWASEETVVRYYSQVDKRVRRYFPDFVIKVKDKNGIEKTYMIEIKPSNQTTQPKRPKKVGRRYIKQLMEWQVNQDKWQAATKFCKEKGMEFMVLTEAHLKRGF